MWDRRVVLGEEGVAATFIFEHQLAFAAVAAGASRTRIFVEKRQLAPADRPLRGAGDAPRGAPQRAELS